MRSDEDNAGFALLNKWKAQPTEIRFSFVAIANKLDISADTVIVAELLDDAMRLEGAGIRVLIDLGGAAFESVGSAEEFISAGLDPSRYPESAEILLDNGDKVVLSALPPRPERFVN